MAEKTLDEWLAWIETLNPEEIDLGLERVHAVYTAMAPDLKNTLVITVAGTNGKGSSITMLEAILMAAGYSVGCYTSPHLLRYNERIRVNGTPVSDQMLCSSFDNVNRARGDIPLTYFEFGTLSALDIFSRMSLDVLLLEVGLGGRLDAVNIVDADAVLLTNVALDHTEWLGPDRESIGLEKSGVFRRNQPAVTGDTDPPASVIESAARIGTPLWCAGRDFSYQKQDNSWSWTCHVEQGIRLESLPLPGLYGDIQLENASAVLMLLYLLGERLAISESAIQQGLVNASLPGRFQRRMHESDVEEILDVAHNPDSALALASALRTLPATGTTRGLVAMLSDKDLPGVIAALDPVVDEWHIAPLEDINSLRRSTVESISERLGNINNIKDVRIHDDVLSARNEILRSSEPGDRLVVFGSFYTVAKILSQGV